LNIILLLKNCSGISRVYLYILWNKAILPNCKYIANGIGIRVNTNGIVKKKKKDIKKKGLQLNESIYKSNNVEKAIRRKEKKKEDELDDNKETEIRGKG
jgi:hypothetical protein